MKILVTGCAGFIGYSLCYKLLKNKKNIIFGIDNVNNYYDVELKKNRLKKLKKNKNFFFKKIDICNNSKLSEIFKKNKFHTVVNLAAQAGVRNSIDNPEIYFEYNLIGFFNIIECSRSFKVNHLIYASTSSVYGNATKFPLKENNNTDHPQSFYAATKKCNEVIAYSYSQIYNLKTTGLRFFTVYGPFGRPDMALFKFVEKLSKSKKIDLYNNGNHYRDFTYIDDVIGYVEKLIFLQDSNGKYNIYNICTGKTIYLKNFLNEIIKNLKLKKPKINKLKLQTGDVKKTHGSNKEITKFTNFKPRTNIKEGIKNFINWYADYNK